MATNSIINVFIVDDHMFIRAGIRKLLHDTPDIRVSGEACSGEEAIQKIRELSTPPDVLLTDIALPGISGIELTSRLVRMFPQLKIIGLSAYEENFFPIQILRAGAKGYLTKNVLTSEVIQAIHVILKNNQRFITPSVAEKMAFKDTEKKSASLLNKLTPREFEIIWMTCQGKKPDDIAKALFISLKTVNVYRYGLFKKLKVENGVGLIKLASECGLITME